MKETSLTYCGECLQEFKPGQVVWFAWIENRCFCAACQSKLPIGQWEPRLVPKINDVVGKVADLVNELHQVIDNEGIVISVDSEGEKSVNVVLAKKFFCLFESFDVEDREDYKYPYTAFVEIDDVRFYTILSKEKYEQYVLKTA